MHQFKGINRKPDLLAGVEKTPTEGILEVRRPEIIAISIYAIRVYGPFGLIQRHGAYEGHSVGASASMRCVRKLM